jgi:ABC-type multidrug transport system fused ATPase/permease subunit
VIVGRGFEQTGAGDIVGIVLFVISLISMIITVYVARIVLLVAMVINANNVRTPDNAIVLDDRTLPGEHDPEYRKSACQYQFSFCVHTILQMFAQLLAYIAIAAKIRYDNRHFYRIGNTDESINVSSFLWYMIIAGYVTPILGHLSFFIVTHYWGEQYPIGFRIDMMRIFQMTEIGIIDISNFKNKIKERMNQLEQSLMKDKGLKVERFLGLFQPCKNDFDKLVFRKSWFSKFKHPFKSPMLVIICLLYSVLQLAFIICAARAVDDMGVVVTHVLNGGGWVIYYIFALIVGIVANLYIFLVVGLWVAIITAILVAIALIIALIIGYICLVVMCSGNSNKNYNRNY